MSSAISRRRFLTRGSLAACAAVGWASPWAASATAPATQTAARFLALIDTPFSASALSKDGAPALTLWLREVQALKLGPGTIEARPTDESFVLKFSVEGTTAAQDTYALAHESMPVFAALLVPSRSARTLTAVYNRSV